MASRKSRYASLHAHKLALTITDQIVWAEEFLSALDDLDHRQILTIFVFYPSEAEETLEDSITKRTSRRRLLPMSSDLDMGWFIDQEWGAEAGNMLLSGKLTRLAFATLLSHAQFAEAPHLNSGLVKQFGRAVTI